MAVATTTTSSWRSVQAGGKIRATDVYSFSTGERMTKAIRRLYLPLAANQSRNIVEKLVTSESDMVKAFAKLKSFSDAARDKAC